MKKIAMHYWVIVFQKFCRYFKLVYIVAGILLSNDDICDTVDKIRIAPHVEIKEKSSNHQQQQFQSVSSSRASSPTHRAITSGDQKKSYGVNKALDNCWFRKINIFHIARKLRNNFRPYWRNFSVWTIPNYLLEYSTHLLYRKFSDDDLIYK